MVLLVFHKNTDQEDHHTSAYYRDYEGHDNVVEKVCDADEYEGEDDADGNYTRGGTSPPISKPITASNLFVWKGTMTRTFTADVEETGQKSDVVITLKKSDVVITAIHLANKFPLKPANNTSHITWNAWTLLDFDKHLKYLNKHVFEPEVSE